MKWASNMTTDDIRAELVELDKRCARFEAASDDERSHGGSPGEGMYERHDELTRELRRRERIEVERENNAIHDALHGFDDYGWR